MKSEKEFKEILNEKLGSKEFEFDAGNWEQAREMLDASREEKKRRPFFFILLSAAMLIIGGFALYLFNSPESSEKKTIASTSNSSETETPVAKQPSAIINSSSQHEIKNTDQVSERKPVNENKEAVKETKEINSRDKAEVVTDLKENASVQETRTTESAENTSNTSVPSENKIVRKKKMKANANEKISVSIVVNGKDPLIKDPVKSSSLQQEGNSEPVKTSDPVVKQQTPDTTKSDDGHVNSNPENSSVPVSSNTMAANTSSVEETTVKDPSVNETTVAVNVPVKKDTLPVTTATVTKVDSAAAITQTPVKPQKAYNGIVSVEGGINYFVGWKNPGKRDAKGYNPVAGINYSTKIYKRIGITVGAQYYWVGQLSYSNHTSKVTRYSLGEESNVTVITPTKLHYVGFPVILGYNLNDKHHFGLGCNIGYLMTVSGKVETYYESFKGISNMETSKTTGYTEGFRPFDTQLLLIYRRKIITDLYVNTGFVIGLSDIKDNSFFGSNVYERNLGVKFTLTYNLYKR